MHSTNYYNTLILASPDSVTLEGKTDFRSGSVAARQYEMIMRSLHLLTSDDVIFGVFADRNNIVEADRSEARRRFFSRAQVCLRASPLVKTYGFGIYHDAQGHVALYGVEATRYQELVDRENVKKIYGMRSKRT